MRLIKLREASLDLKLDLCALKALSHLLALRNEQKGSSLRNELPWIRGFSSAFEGSSVLGIPCISGCRCKFPSPCPGWTSFYPRGRCLLGSSSHFYLLFCEEFSVF